MYNIDYVPLKLHKKGKALRMVNRGFNRVEYNIMKTKYNINII